MNILRNARVYLFFDALNKAIPFFLLPVLTAYLAPESYGNLALFSVSLTFVGPFVHLVLYANIQRNYFRQSKESTARLIFNLQVVTAIAAGLVSLLAFLGKPLILDYLQVPAAFIWLVPLVLLLSVNTEYFLIVLRNESHTTTFGIFQLVTTAINLGLSLVLVVGLHLDWIGRVYGILASMGLMGLSSCLFLYRRGLISVSFDWKLIKNCLFISLPLIPNALSGAVLNLSDRFFVENMVGREALGVYAVGYSLGMIMSFLVVALNNAISPWIYKQLQITEARGLRHTQEKLVRFTWLYFLLMVFLALSITVGCHVLLYLGFLPEAYQQAREYILWVSLAYACHGMMLVIFPYLAHTGKTTYYFPLSLMAAIVNLIGNFWLIQIYGALGAAYATILAYIVLLTGTWIYAQRVFPMPWFDREVLRGINLRRLRDIMKDGRP